MSAIDKIDFENMSHEEYFQSAIGGLKHAGCYSPASKDGQTALTISLLYSVMSVYKFLVDEREEKEQAAKLARKKV